MILIIFIRLNYNTDLRLNVLRGQISVSRIASMTSEVDLCCFCQSFANDL